MDTSNTNSVFIILPFLVIAVYVGLQEDMSFPMLLIVCISAVAMYIMSIGMKSESDLKKKEQNDADSSEDMRDEFRISLTDGAESVVTKLKLCVSLEENPTAALEKIRVICRKKNNAEFISRAIDMHLHKHVLDCIMDISPCDDTAIFAIAGDILIDLCRKHEQQRVSDGVSIPLKSNKLEFREFVDKIISTLQNQIRKVKQMRRIMNDDNSRSVIYDAPAANTSKRSKDTPLTSYEESAYKLIMLLGFLAADDTNAQTMIGDRGGLQIVLEYMDYYQTEQLYLKWCCWALIHLTFSHPPNKVEFVRSDGIVNIMNCLRYHTSKSTAVVNVTSNATATDMYYQAIGLLYNILNHDSQAKMNVAQVRQLVLSEGIVDITQAIQKQQRVDFERFQKTEEMKHKKAGTTPVSVSDYPSSSIDEMISILLEVIMSDWS